MLEHLKTYFMCYLTSVLFSLGIIQDNVFFFQDYYKELPKALNAFLWTGALLSGAVGLYLFSRKKYLKIPIPSWAHHLVKGSKFEQVIYLGIMIFLGFFTLCAAIIALMPSQILEFARRW